MKGKIVSGPDKYLLMLALNGAGNVIFDLEDKEGKRHSLTLSISEGTICPDSCSGNVWLLKGYDPLKRIPKIELLFDSDTRTGLYPC